MKRIVCLVVCFGFFALYLPAESEAKPGFGLRLYGGLNMLDGGDLNVGVEGMFDKEKDYFRSMGYGLEGEFSPARLGFHFGGEFLFMFNPVFGLSFGIGTVSASKASVMEFTDPGVNREFSHLVKACAIPLRLSLNIFAPFSPSLSIFFNAGLGYYLARAYYEMEDHLDGLSHTYIYDTSAGGLGVHGGLGVQLALSRMFGIMAELAGRFASFAGFEGETENLLPERCIITGTTILPARSQCWKSIMISPRVSTTPTPAKPRSAFPAFLSL